MKKVCETNGITWMCSITHCTSFFKTEYNFANYCISTFYCYYKVAITAIKKRNAIYRFLPEFTDFPGFVSPMCHHALFFSQFQKSFAL